MQLMWFNNLIRPNRFYRAVAIFFLVFTAIDLTVPSFCSEEGLADERGTFAQSASDETVSGYKFTSSSGIDNSCPNQPAHSSDVEEDCFCCCSHVIPGCHISLAV